MEENTQLPKEVVAEINSKAIEVVLLFVKDVNAPGYQAIKGAAIKGATAYATKLHQADTRNGLLKTEIKHLNTVIENLNAQPAPRWVKALPADDAVQNWFEENIDKGCGASSAIYKFRLWLESLQREFQVKRQQAIGLGLIEDEQPAAGREDAVVFAQWLATERWQPRINTEWARYETVYSDVSVKTTGELYKLFKQQKENP